MAAGGKTRGAGRCRSRREADAHDRHALERRATAVAIARALIQAPALLLADEPVASLDEATACIRLDLLASLSRAHGMALICTLHQSALATRFCDRLFEMKDGRLTERKIAQSSALPPPASTA